ncbi:DUF223 domain-containing protein [Heracleum sosnowskyi]|uniref:DUF223 domain-containing protein n=1 Tax=Heracleum sosnowskyi TaxID=360622 RepID=A0AAD8IYR4_9APIA|nr:DUF223 domain-containing protein [Heracleum sosnowskyi]
MELYLYESIKDFHTSTYDWKCRVRLQNVWKGIKRDTLEFYGLNMIFIDDHNSRIHAFTSSKYCEDILKDITEGKIYVLSNFKVKDFVGDETYRPVRNKKHIYFTAHTELTVDESPGLEIENFAFDLYHMSEMQKIAGDNRFLVDMVGKVENIQSLIKTSKNNQEKTLLKFEISDGSYNVKVTLFDKLGESIEKLFRKLDQDNIYIIISCARVGTYEESPNLTNYPATKIYINPEHYSVNELKQNMAHMQSLMSIPEIIPMKQKLLTVKEIKELPANFNEVQVNCEVSVRRVDENVSWYYNKCTGCKQEIYRDNGVFKCTKCPRIIPYPDKRFRVCTICSDSTGSIQIIFPDSVVSRITETTVVDIHSECLLPQDEDTFPDILKVFLNQKYQITLKLNNDNLKNGSTVYEAEEIVQSREICDSSDPNKEVSMQIEEDSSNKDIRNEDLTFQTPQTGNSTNVKTRARKNVEPVSYDDTGNDIFEKLKNMKKEKKGKRQEVGENV